MKGMRFLICEILVVTTILFCNTAGATDFTATISGSDTFVVPASPLGGVSGCGIISGTHTYSADPLLIDTSGTYTFTATGDYTGDFDDPFMAVYSPAFNAADPTANLVACNDDWIDHPVDSLFPRFSASLTAGTSYIIVTTTFGTGINSGTVDFTITPDVTLLTAGDGECGSADGTTITSAPTGDTLCDAGTPSTVTDTGTNFTWTCYGVGYNVANDSCSATKGKSDQTITFGTLASRTYGDNPFDLTATASSGLTVSYTSSNTAVATISGSTVTIVGIGSTNITASQAGNASYNPAEDVAQAQTISVKGLTVSSAVAQDKVYDGTTTAVISGGTLVGVESGDTVSLADNTSGTFAQSGIGTDISVISAMTLNGADAGNYSLSQPTLSADISAKGLTVSGAVAEDKVYDGTTTAVISGGTLVGVESGDTVSLADNTSGTFAQSGIGTDISVSSTMTLSGADSGNYSLSQPTLSADISAKGLTVISAVAQDKVYDGTTAAVISGGTLVGVESGDTVSLADNTSGTFAQSGIGTDISVSSAMTLSGADAGNYSLSQPTLSADISAKGLTVISAVAQDKVYDGTTAAVISGGTLVGVESGDTVSLADNTSGTFAQSGIGTDISVISAMTLSGADAGNYSLSQPTLSADISAKGLTLTASDQIKTYGSEFTFIGTEFSSEGLVSGDSITSVTLTSDGAVSTASVGNYPINISMAQGSGLSNYLTNYVEGTIAVGKSNQAINFSTLPEKTCGDAPFDLTASASSGLGVSYSSSDLSVATISGSTVSIVGAGTITITASQAGDTNFNAASNVQQNLTVAAVLPTVTTTAVSAISFTTAASGGNVTDSGGTNIMSRGVCWSTSENPTTANDSTSDNTGPGEFASSITGLTPGVTYYVRAFATNSVGTAYGGNTQFDTPGVAVIESVADGNWSESSTWQYGLVPDSSQGALIRHMVSLDMDAGINDLQIVGEKTLSITGSNRLSVNGDTTIAGTLDVADGIGSTEGSTIISDTLLINNGSYTAGGSFNATDGSVVFSDAGYLNLSGTIECNSLGAFSRSEGCTVSYDADGNQFVNDSGYHNLILSGSGTKTLCDDMVGDNNIAGDVSIDTGVTLHASDNSYNVEVAGDWINEGTFTAVNGTVTLNGEDQYVFGATSFYNLTKISQNQAVLFFENGVQSRTTVLNALTLQGAGEHLLSLRSDIDGEPWELDPVGSITIAYLDVQDANNVGGSDIVAGGTGSVDSGNNTAWIFYVLPIVTTREVTDIGTTSAIGHGIVGELGIPDPSQHGVCWSTSSNPTTEDNLTQLGAVSATGAFNSTISGLIPDTRYYVRAYSVNSFGTAYGDEVTFSTYSDLDTDRDGLPDYLDEDDDGDNITDAEEGETDTDGDGTADSLDQESDGDNVDDDIENGAPNNGDGNGDGIPDRIQRRVTSLKTYDGSNYITLESPTGTTLANVQATDNPAPEDMPPGTTFSCGLFDFTINGLVPGSSTQLIIYLPEGTEPDSYIKYGPTPENPMDHWYEFIYDGSTGAQISSNVITLHFVDAERGDDILTQDSMVVDLGGPLFHSNENDDSTNYGPLTNGCFLNSVPSINTLPMASKWVSAGLFVLLAIVVVPLLRRMNRRLTIIGLLLVCLLAWLPVVSGADDSVEILSPLDSTYYLSIGAGFAYIDESFTTEYLGSDYELEVNNALYPILRVGRNLSKNLALEMGLAWHIYSGEMEEVDTSGTDALYGYSFVIGPVYSGNEISIQKLGAIRPIALINLNYTLLPDTYDYPVQRFDPGLGADMAIGFQRGLFDVRLGYRYLKLDRGRTLDGVNSSDTSSELDLSGFFLEMSYRFSLPDNERF